MHKKELDLSEEIHEKIGDALDDAWYCLDKDGDEISMGDTFRLMDEPGYARICKSQLPDGSVVSTVWSGLNTMAMKHGAPPERHRLFETIHFSVTGAAGTQESYSTEVEAIEGHWRIVRKVMRR